MEAEGSLLRGEELAGDVEGTLEGGVDSGQSLEGIHIT